MKAIKIVLMLGLFAVVLSPSVFGQKFVLPSVISPVAKKSDWPVLRARIHDVILKTWGQCPVKFGPAKNSHQEVSRYKKYGLTLIVYKYQVVGDSWDRGILVLPHNFDQHKKYPLVLAIHGTNGKEGADGMLDYEKLRRRAYGIELAKRGYLVFCPDQFGFGESIKDKSQDAVYSEFEAKYPDWTITGRQILGLIRAIDCASQFPFVNMTNGVGAIGNSLGGRSALYLMAFDQRVSVAVVSAGVSPMISNTYRGLNQIRRAQPFYWDEVEKHADYPWDYNEMIALCAPRALFIIEPSNDPYNPFIECSFHAVLSALPVWKLYDSPEKLNFLMHGDGHDTRRPVREMAYEWFDRFLMQKGNRK